MHALAKLTLLIAAACGLIFATSVHAYPKFDSIVAFGDSWTDNVRCSISVSHPAISLSAQGNGTWIQTNHSIPTDPAFWQGRFSNGPTWVEHLQILLDVKMLHDMAHGGGKHAHHIFFPCLTFS
jgi:phospholipase/lecithinase/hemolysin